MTKKLTEKLGDLNKLVELASKMSVSFTVSYWEACDELEISIHSAAKSEEYYEKRAGNVDRFIERYKEHLAEQGIKFND